MEGRASFSHPSLSTPAETWYQVHGSLDSSTIPIIILHGGPGATHAYLTDLAYLQKAHNRTVIFYDQLGCGNSTRFKERRLDTKFWTVELFIAELNNLISHLGLTEYDLLGHSWGGMLGAEYAIQKNDKDSSRGLKRLIISNSPASMKLWVTSCDEWRALLPREIDETLEKYEKAQDYDAEPYKAAVLEFYQRHVCRVRHPDGVQPFPDPVMNMIKLLEEDDTVYFTMNGPSEFTVIGSLKEWSVIGRLEAISVPTLVINGEFDEGRRICVEPFARDIKGAEWVTIEGASHCAHVEKTEEYCELVVNWLNRS